MTPAPRPWAVIVLVFLILCLLTTVGACTYTAVRMALQ